VVKKSIPCHIYRLDLSNQVFYHSDRVVEKLLFLLQGMPFENILKIYLPKEKPQNDIAKLDLLPLKSKKIKGQNQVYIFKHKWKSKLLFPYLKGIKLASQRSIPDLNASNSNSSNLFATYSRCFLFSF
jgi:hypothetical protein